MVFQQIAYSLPPIWKKKLYYQGAKLFNELPIGLQSLTPRILFKKALNPLSSESDQNQFSPNNIHTLSRD